MHLCKDISGRIMLDLGKGEAESFENAERYIYVDGGEAKVRETRSGSAAYV